MGCAQYHQRKIHPEIVHLEYLCSSKGQHHHPCTVVPGWVRYLALTQHGQPAHLVTGWALHPRKPQGQSHSDAESCMYQKSMYRCGKAWR